VNLCFACLIAAGGQCEGEKWPQDITHFDVATTHMYYRCGPATTASLTCAADARHCGVARQVRQARCVIVPLTVSCALPCTVHASIPLCYIFQDVLNNLHSGKAVQQFHTISDHLKIRFQHRLRGGSRQHCLGSLAALPGWRQHACCATVLLHSRRQLKQQDQLGYLTAKGKLSVHRRLSVCNGGCRLSKGCSTRDAV
jgi:hypothetical protein